MATRFRLRNLASDINPGAAVERYLMQRSGRASVTKATNTTASGTNIAATDSAGGSAVEWFSAPVTKAVTISGTVTAYLRGLESNNLANTGAGILIQRCDNSGAVLATILADSTVPTTITEFSTSDAAKTQTWTPTSTNMAVGERIKVVLKVRNVGTMATGYTTTFSVDGPSDAAAGGSYVEFTEDIITDDPVEMGMQELQGCGYFN